METAMNGIVKSFALAGATTPFVIMIIAYIEVHLDPSRIPLTTSYGFYLWPSRVLLMGQGENFTVGSLTVLMCSILLNILLYAIAGWIVGIVLKRRSAMNR